MQSSVGQNASSVCHLFPHPSCQLFHSLFAKRRRQHLHAPTTTATTTRAPTTTATSPTTTSTTTTLPINQEILK